MSAATQAQPERRPKKVLHVLSGAVGGAALSALGVMRALRNEGIDACVVCHDMGTELREQLADATKGEVLFTPLYWWNKKNRSKAWKRPLLEARQVISTGWARGSAARVATFAVAHGVDLVHTCNVMTPEGSLAARWLHLPHVWHVRELIGPGRPFRLPVEGPPLGEWMARRASKVVANSAATADCIRPWLPEGLLEVVPNGIDLEGFVTHRPSPVPVVAMAGSLASRSKRHDLFLEVARRVGAKAEFRIYGGGPRDAYVRELEAANSAGVRFMGPFDDPAQVMKDIDVLVQPSEGESFGRVVVEAMAASVPVVAVGGGGAAEIVADGVTGLLAPPGDAAALAAHVESLLRDPARRERLGAAGQRRAREKFSMEACAAGIERVYRMAMTRPL